MLALCSQSRLWFKVLKKVGGTSSQRSSPSKIGDFIILAELPSMSSSAPGVRMEHDHSGFFSPIVCPKLDACWGGCILYLSLAPGPVSLPALQETDEVV